jgi:hypothetical protein
MVGMSRFELLCANVLHNMTEIGAIHLTEIVKDVIKIRFV